MISPDTLPLTSAVKIESVAHLSETLIEANALDTPVVPIGGGTCLSTGSVPSHDFVGLDLAGLSGLIDYVPTDMTAAFHAGTPVQEVRSVLSANGQELPIDLAADDAGTIGGLVVTGFAGPRRYAQGTLKDLLIGCEYVRGDGLIAKAGGMTVKNVSGFEISRMLHGSWGSLAVLTRVNLKVLPIARVDRTISWFDADLPAAIERQLRLLEQFPGATALQTRQTVSGWQTAIRFAGRSTSVDDYEQQTISNEGQPLVSDPIDNFWVPRMPTTDAPQLVASDSVVDLRSMLGLLSQNDGLSQLTFSFGTGSVQATISSNCDIQALVSNMPTNLWMIEGGSTPFRKNLAPWGPARADHAVMQSIKQQFDPGNILNRGRLFV